MWHKLLAKVYQINVAFLDLNNTYRERITLRGNEFAWQQNSRELQQCNFFAQFILISKIYYNRA